MKESPEELGALMDPTILEDRTPSRHRDNNDRRCTPPPSRSSCFRHSITIMALIVIAILGYEAGKYRYSDESSEVSSMTTLTGSGVMNSSSLSMTGLEDIGWWDDRLEGMATTWEPFQNHSIWCLDVAVEDARRLKRKRGKRDSIPANRTSTTSRPADGDNDCSRCSPRHGIMFVKNPKSASSTGAGVTARISHNLARRMGHQHNCPTQYNHGYGLGRRHKNVRKSQAILWTVVRHPSKRALSAYFYYMIGGKGGNFSEDAMIKFFGNYRSTQADYLLMENPQKRHYLPTKNDIVTQILNHYSFIAIAERMNESLVAMKLLFDLQLEDMVVLSTKIAGSWGYGMKGEFCKHIPEKRSTPRVDAFLANEFTEENADFLLYAAAYQSLDLTIDSLGRSLVESQVLELEKLQRLAEEQCSDKAIFPCAADGHNQVEKAADSCYENDFGCGYRCVDEVLGQT